jgi:hypothetical protein
MNKFLLFIFSIIIFLIITPISGAVTFTFENDTDKCCTFLLYWHDHNFTDYPYPANMYGSDHAAHEIDVLEHDYPGRIFTVIVYQDDKYKKHKISTKEKTRHIYYIWDGTIINAKESK